jgi:transglutaminase-like putative cysteine protease
MAERRRLQIDHETRYAFTTPARHGVQQARLTPRTGSSQTVEDWALDVEGARAEATFNDQYGNRVTLLCMTPGAVEIVIRARGTLTTVDAAGVVGPHEGVTPLWLFRRVTPRTTLGAGLRGLLAELPPEEHPITLLHALSNLLADRIAYDVGRTDSETTAEQAFAAGRGVCQDHAQAFIGCVRALGFPARYVSGYLLMDDVIEQDAGHAWAEAYLDSLGWVGFDVSNRISPDSRYVRVAVGLDSSEAAPISGVLDGACPGEMSVAVRVQQQ